MVLYEIMIKPYIGVKLRNSSRTNHDISLTLGTLQESDNLAHNNLADLQRKMISVVILYRILEILYFLQDVVAICDLVHAVEAFLKC